MNPLIYAFIQLLIFCLVVYVVIWVIQSVFGPPAQAVKIIYLIAALMALLFALDVIRRFSRRQQRSRRAAQCLCDGFDGAQAGRLIPARLQIHPAAAALPPGQRGRLRQRQPASLTERTNFGAV